ncbi:MAG: rhomboid family intramembrane serine protease [Bacteroidales bacterium]|nr:rhomboid family intramembrane serine protease [Bacteroidales bacterium]
MTLIIIVVTALVSILAFYDHSMFARLQFNAYQVIHRRQYYRIVTHGFVHANWWHLFVNMFVLYFFGTSAEHIIGQLATAGLVKFPVALYIVFYVLAIVFSSSISLYKQKDNYLYNSVGASGATSAVLMFSIFFNPWQMIGVYFIPVPGIIFAVLYIIYSQYMAKRGGDNIAHDAHLLGSVFGFIFPLFIDLGLIYYFIESLKRFQI